MLKISRLHVMTVALLAMGISGTAAATDTPSSGLGQSWPNATDVSANPHWHVYVFVKDGEAWLSQLQITEYPWANRWNHAPKRERKLLLHRKEIDKLDEAVARQGYTILPLELYLKRGFIKVLVGVCRGKKVHDKRASEKERDAKREMQAATRRAQRR